MDFNVLQPWLPGLGAPGGGVGALPLLELLLVALGLVDGQRRGAELLPAQLRRHRDARRPTMNHDNTN